MRAESDESVGAARRAKGAIRGALRQWWVLYLIALACSHLVEWALHEDARTIPAVENTVVIPAMADDGPIGSEQVRMALRRWGETTGEDRPLVILLHGSPGLASNFSRLGELLAAHEYEVVAPDLPGFGRTIGPTPSLSIRAHARAVLAMMDRMGVRRAHVVGWSLGGAVGLHMADLAPERMATLTMLASAGAQHTEGSGDYSFEHAKYALGMVVFTAMPELVPHFGLLRGDGAWLASMRNFRDTDLRPMAELMRRLETPTLILHGRYDPLVADWAAEEHHRLIPTSRLVMLDAGPFLVSHLLPFMHADETAGYLVEFFKRHDEPGVAPLTGAFVQDGAEPRPAMFGLIGSGLARVPRELPWWVSSLGIVLAAVVLPRTTTAASGLAIGLMRLDIGVAMVGIVLGRGVRLRPRRSARRWVALLAGVPFLLVLLLLLAPPFVIALFERLGESGAVMGVLAITATLIVISWTPMLFTWKGRRRLRAKFSRARHHEYWPSWALYLLLVPHFLRLSIRHRGPLVFTACNPAIGCGGGVIGESKHAIMQGLAHAGEAALRTVLIEAGGPSADRARATLDAIASDPGLGGLPAVLKPDAGQRGHDVFIARTERDVREYFKRVRRAVVVQRFHPGPRECAVLWCRHPDGPRQTPGGERVGFIFAATRKEFATVVGDARSTIERLVYAHARYYRQADALLAPMGETATRVPHEGEHVEVSTIGNHSRGAEFRDGADLITPELERVIDEISAAFPAPPGGGLDSGRYDLRYACDDALRRGEGFAIIELNGVTGEPTNLYDPDRSLGWALSIMCRHWETMYRLGAVRRRMGHRPIGVLQLARMLISFRRSAR
ncbi:MAG: alpha/beta fold hydrolase [Planctomycetes bacterium]|nr:alpha/beta fold hydrolase [Planctomycetota bacterium]